MLETIFRRNRLLPVLILWLSASCISANEAQTLEWDDLIPESHRAKQALQANTQIDHNQTPPNTPAESIEAPVRQDLNGKKVKLPGFVVPLDGDEKKVTEFLLVPYFGACIHMPPPPENQIVYVYYEKGVNVDMIYDPIWIEGTLRAVKTQSDLATSGYSMFADLVTAYEVQ